MKIRRIIAIAFSTIIFLQAASAEVIKLSGEAHDEIYVECLGDTIVIDWEFDRVVTTIETKKTWMFTRNVRQKGVAHDSAGNTWKFNGHFQKTEHVDLTAEAYTTKFHLLSHDVMVGQPGGPGNLLFKTMWRISYVNGVPTLELRETSVSCLP